MVEGGLGPGQAWTRRPRLWVPWIHQLLFETSGAAGNQGLREVALVQRPAVAAGGRVRHVHGFVRREERQAGLRQLPLEPEVEGTQAEV